MKKNWIKSYRGLVLVLLMLASFFMSIPTMAYWNTLIYEKFEQTASSWPWVQNGHQWRWGPNHNYLWAVERNALWHDGAPNDIQSLWCCGFPNDLQAGNDVYAANQANFAVWGPFDLTDAIAAGGNFWGFFDLESNTGGTGDDFYFLVTADTEDPTTNLEDYDYLYQREYGTNRYEWENIPVNFDTVYTFDGDIVSYLGRDTVWIGVYFESDYDSERGFGVFIDDIALGYDDGEYDFEVSRMQIQQADNPDRTYSSLFVNTEVRILGRFMAHGDMTSSEVDHVLYINDEPYDTVRAAWQGSRHGEAYEILFDRTYMPTDTGHVDISFVMDVQNEQEEKFEDNNEESNTYTILPENHEPWIVFLNPTEGGVSAAPGVFPIIYEAYNTPDEEVATVSFLYDNVGEGFSGTPILTGVSVPIENQRDTVYWNMEYLPEDEYFIFAFLDDNFWEPVYQYAPSIMLGVDDNLNGSVPDEFKLVSLYPNPFNPTVELTMELPQNSPVNAFWYSIDGRQVDTQKYGVLSAGTRRVQWTPHNLPSGVYLVKVESSFGTVNGRVTFIK